MSKLNREWHELNRMPPNATDAQRADWHYRHARACGCRALTASIAELLRKNGYEVPAPDSGTVS